MSATCSNFTPTLSNGVGPDFQKSASADGLTVFVTLTDTSGGSTKINFNRSTNGGSTYSGNAPAFATTDIPGVQPNATLTQGDLVCDPTALTQCLFVIGNGTSTVGFQTLYVRVTTDGGMTWGTPVVLSADVFSLTNVHAKRSVTGTITEVIWTQKGLSTDLFSETRTSSSNNNTVWTARTIRAGVDTAFPRITARDDGSEVYATLVNTGATVVEVWKRAAFAGAWALNYTVLLVNSNFPQISCSGTGLTVAVTYFVGILGFNVPLYCATTDNSGAAWTETLMSDAGATSDVTPYNPPPGFVLTDGGHNVVVSNNGNVIHVVWACNSQVDVRHKSRVLGTWNASAVISSIMASFVVFPYIFCSANGAAPYAIWTRDIVADRTVTLATSPDVGVIWSISGVSIGLSTTRTYDNALTVSTLGNNVNIVYGNTNMAVNFGTWSRVCTAASNIVTVTRTFNPPVDFWNTSNQVVYTITMPAFANSDYSLTGITDELLMQADFGPAVPSTVALASLTFPTGAHIGSATTGIITSANPNPMAFTPTGGPLNLSTTSVPSVLILTLNYLIVNLAGNTVTYFPTPLWSNPGDWTGTSTFTTYQGVASTMTSSTGSLMVSDPPCVAEGTLVKLFSGEQKRIEDLRRGEILQGVDGRPVDLQMLVKIARQTANFIQVDSSKFIDSLERNQPLLICENHPVMIFGESIMPQEVGEKVVLAKPKTIYTLITNRRDFVQMQGINVATWSASGWENFVANDNTGSFIEWSAL